jgi:hypothetical protein
MTNTPTRTTRFAPTGREASADTRTHEPPRAQPVRPSTLPAAERPGDGEISPRLDPLIQPTWAELAEAREQHSREAKRLRAWRWWFVGMFTFYTTLVGILLAKLLLGM